MYEIVTKLVTNLNYKAYKTIHIDNVVFKCHYRVTFWILMLSTVLVCSRQYVGEHIRCLLSNEKDKGLGHVANTFCFFMSTYTISKHANNSNTNEVAHPGVGHHTEEDDIIKHAYYQWVPFVLFFQAISFYIPHWLWRLNEGRRIASIVSGFQERDLRKRKSAKLDSIKRVQEQLRERLHINKYWGHVMVLCELANLVNLILQVYFTDLFLSGQFMPLGTQVYDNYNTGTYSPLDVVFPKVTKCTFMKYGPSGTIQTHDIMCVMALNIINEKIFLTLWYWYIILGTLTILGLCYRLLSFFLHSSITFSLMVFRAATSLPMKDSDLIPVMKDMNFSEWLFLRYIAMNLEGRQFVELVAKLTVDLRTVAIDDDFIEPF